MNQKDTATVLGIFTGNWPHKVLEANTPIVWHNSIGFMDADVAIDTAYYLCTQQDHWPSIAEFFDYHAHIIKTKYADRAESRGLPTHTGPIAPEEVTRAGFAQCRAILDGCQPHRKRQRIPDTVDRKIPRREDLAARAANREKAYAGTVYPDADEAF